MSTTDTNALRLRKSWTERITGVIWGSIVTAGGGFLIAALSGYDIDLELIAIIALVALGGWLLASAITVSLRSRPRHEEAWATPDTPDPRGSASTDRE